MVQERTGDARRVLVAGDVTMDWMLARVTGPGEPVTHASQEPGGAAMIGALIAEAAGRIQSEVNSTIEVCRPEPPAGALPTDPRFHHRYAIWKRFEERGGHAWRVDELLSPHSLDAAAVAPGAVPPPSPADPVDLLVLADLGLGFRNKSILWETALDALDPVHGWVLLRMAKPVARGALWQHLQKLADRTIVVIHIDDLRLGEVLVSRELSWERTAQDLLWELLFNPLVMQLARCAHVVVSFTTAGALVFSRPATAEGSSTCRLVFAPPVMDRMWNEEHPGEMIGGLSALTASIARQMLLNPHSPDLVLGVRSGIAAIRALDSGGWELEPDAQGRPHLVFPTTRIVDELSKDAEAVSELVEVVVPLPSRSREQDGEGAPLGRGWSILEGAEPGGLELLAERIVVEGPMRALKDVPIARFARDFTVVDRQEIEGFRSIRKLIREYDSQPEHPQPLSIAVFGPPGSGKSFGIRRVAASILPGRLEEVVFNLSQFDESRELIDALHRVRDISLAGKTPLVFWDEFDTTRLTAGGVHTLGWLRHFLSPMQDGKFRDGQVTHPVGPAIFVFVGGTSPRMEDFAGQLTEEFRSAKGPDFVSRLKGFVDVRGPNPIDDDPITDPYYLIRRAVLLRSLLEREPMYRQQDGSETLDIDRGVLRGLLLTRSYRHGARSLESVLAMSTLSGRTRFERSDLPSEAQLTLHVEARDFLNLVQSTRPAE